MRPALPVASENTPLKVVLLPPSATVLVLEASSTKVSLKVLPWLSICSVPPKK